MWILYSRQVKVMLFVVSPFSEVAVSSRALCTMAFLLCLCASVLIPVTALAQVDERRAQAYFKEATTLCEREGGRLWGVSLIGPMVIADPMTHTIATSQPAPSAPRPPTLGFANSAMKWGDVRWSTFVWQHIPAYASGTAYGLLLDDFAPGWARKVKQSDDLGQLLMTAAKTQPAGSSTAAASRYDGPTLRLAEEKREVERKARIAELRRRFVDGPVLLLPAGGNFSFAPAGMTAIPGAGTIYPNFRVTGKWGSLEAAEVLMSTDKATLTVPAPTAIEGTKLRGDGWTIELSPGWEARSGPRKGDVSIVERSR
jgi:hypothetical protein